MKNKSIPYNDPALCANFVAPKRCAAGWFHGKCVLLGACIRCPKYESKTGLTYDIVNEDEIIKALSPEYFLEHVIASLKFAFTESPVFIETNYIDPERQTITINDVADNDCMLEFSIVDERPGKMYLRFNGRIKG